MMITRLALGLFMLYNSFPRLTAGLRDCAHYWQCLTDVTVSLVHTSSSHCWCPWAFQKNKHHPWIVEQQKEIAMASNQRNMVYFITIVSRILYLTHPYIIFKAIPKYFTPKCFLLDETLVRKMYVLLDKIQHKQLKLLTCSGTTKQHKFSHCTIQLLVCWLVDPSVLEK